MCDIKLGMLKVHS